MTADLTTVGPVPLVDLRAQRERIGDRIDAAVARVIAHGKFIMGPEVGELERRLAEYCDVAHVVGVASGTDALFMALLALDIGRGDAVIVPTFTFAATAEVVALLGATPVFVDVQPDTGNIDPKQLVAALHSARAADVIPRAVIAVDFAGQPADYDELEAFCVDYDLALIADAAQSFGATWRGRRTGAIGTMACTSFFPAKPLGCYGDGGAVFTNDGDLAQMLRSLRVHGQGTDKYDNVRVGLNGRLDTIQAAVLLEKLSVLDEEIAARERVAARYDAALAGLVEIPVVRPEATSAWASYTVQVDDRDGVAAALDDSGIATAVYYPRPLHRQPAYADFPQGSDGLAVSERLSTRVLALPMHPDLEPATQDRVIRALTDVVTETV
jgi:UDP-2-acetamido-2-deoxy-ribo-hexuluronate aminotransferase